MRGEFKATQCSNALSVILQASLFGITPIPSLSCFPLGDPPLCRVAVVFPPSEFLSWVCSTLGCVSIRMSLKYSSFSALGLLINWSSVWHAFSSKLSNTDCTVEKCRTGRSRTKLSNMLTTIPSARSLLNLFQFRSSVTGSTIWYFIKLKKMSSQFFLVFCPFCWQLDDLQSKGFQLFVCFLFCFVF